MKKLLMLITAISFLTACEYHELAELEINGTKYTFTEDQVLGFYQTVGSQTNSIVIADDGLTAVTITVKNNVSGLYTCQNGTDPLAKIYITYAGGQYSTEFGGSTGSIDMISAGANLIEGTFSGSLRNSSGTTTIAVTNGKFSGRAY